MKESYYFSHDFEPTNDPKICAMISVYGAAGYGLYWRIVEMLHSESTHFLKFKDYVFMAIAKQMVTDAATVRAFVEDCINVFELFVSDGEGFYSERVMRNMDLRSAISAKRSEAGKRGAMVKQMQANAKQMQANEQQNEAKEKKGKERKRKESKGNEIKEKEKKIEREGTPDGVATAQIYFQSLGATIEQAEEFFDYYESNGWKVGKNPMRDWRAAARRWIRTDIKTPKQKENLTTGLKSRPEAIYDTGKMAAEALKQKLRENGYTNMGSGTVLEIAESGSED